jgi:hypothetical protein
VRAWQQAALVDRVFPAVARQGWSVGPYINLVDHRDITKGLVNFGSGPRFSTGYAALWQRPAILVETHMLKPYAERVAVTEALLVELLREFDRRGGALARALERADGAPLAAPGKDLPILFKPTDQAETFGLAGVAFSRSESLISGDVWTRYDPATRKTYEVPFYRDMIVAKSARLPAAYAIAPGWVDAIERVAAHGLRSFRVGAGVDVTARGWRIDDAKWASRPFEGRIGLTAFTAADVDESVALEPGTVVVPLDQAGAAVAAHLLEPDAPDSLLRWGYFNAAFEQKEYADARKAEQLARDMLAADPGLQAEFDRALADPAFAGNPQARLNWFYLRSRWADPRMNRLPVWRLDAEALAVARAAAAESTASH